MTSIPSLQSRLRTINRDYPDDPEVRHIELGKAILEHIGDDEVWQLYEEATQWVWARNQAD